MFCQSGVSLYDVNMFCCTGAKVVCNVCQVLHECYGDIMEAVAQSWLVVGAINRGEHIKCQGQRTQSYLKDILLFS